jgi:lipopolysaccharide export LptBFGC system permease protein LptF
MEEGKTMEDKKSFTRTNKIGACLIIGLISLHVLSQILKVQLLPGFLSSILVFVIVLILGLFLVLKKEKKKPV